MIIPVCIPEKLRTFTKKVTVLQLRLCKKIVKWSRLLDVYIFPLKQRRAFYTPCEEPTTDFENLFF